MGTALKFQIEYQTHRPESGRQFVEALRQYATDLADDLELDGMTLTTTSVAVPSTPPISPATGEDLSNNQALSQSLPLDHSDDV